MFKKLRNIIPALKWLPDYTVERGKADLVAGITTGVLLVPQGMAYALLAGVPPIYGLYAALIPTIFYALLGTSPHLSIGPVAVSSLLVWAGISQLPEVTTMQPDYISLVILTGLLVGAIQLLMGVLRLGFLVQFLSRPVLAGFTSAAAVIIGVAQLHHLLGIKMPRFEQTYQRAEYVLTHLELTNPLTGIIALMALLILIWTRYLYPKIPGSLLVVILGIAMAYFLPLELAGVALVGTVPEGLPGFVLPDWTLENVHKVLPTAITVAIIGVVEGISIGKAIQAKSKAYEIQPNQELFAMGMSKIVGSFFQAMPSSASFSRSAINYTAGGITGMVSIVASSLVLLTLLFLTPLFYYLPKAILASIIFMAIIGLVEIKEARRLWQIHRQDFSMMIATFVLTLALGIDAGVLIGVILSIVLVVLRTTQPHIAVLGEIGNTKIYRNIERFPEACEKEGVLIVRMDGALYFGNSDFFKNEIRHHIANRRPHLKMLLLDASSFYEIDSSGLQAILDIVQELKKEDIEFYMSGAIGPVRDLLDKADFSAKVDPKNQFMQISNALEAYDCDASKKEDLWSNKAIQANQRKKEKWWEIFKGG